MKLEIDIDEDYYKIICKRVEDNKPYHSPYEYEVIADGKALEQEPVIEKIRFEILDNAFSVVNPHDTYEYINVIDLDSIDKILDECKAETEGK